MIGNRLVLVLCVLLVAAGCRTTFVRRGTIPEPTPTPESRSVGSEVSVRLEPTPAPGSGADGEAGGEADGSAFVFTLVDQNDLNPVGIPVEVTGPIEGRFTSDASGRVRIDGPPGRYRVRVVPGCTGEVEVLEGGAGDFGIATGQTGHSELPLTWRHRFAPGPPAIYSKGPYWPPGEEIRIRYDVVDRCSGGDRAPDRSLPTFRVVVGNLLEVLEGARLRSDPDGFGWVVVRCLDEGEPTLVLVDRANPSDELDLLESRLDQGYVADEPPSCRSSFSDGGA